MCFLEDFCIELGDLGSQVVSEGGQDPVQVYLCLNQGFLGFLGCLGFLADVSCNHVIFEEFEYGSLVLRSQHVLTTLQAS